MELAMEIYNHKYSPVTRDHKIKTSGSYTTFIIHRPDFLTSRIERIFYILIINCILLTVNCYPQFTGALVPDFKVNDDVTTFNNLGGSIGIDGQGNFVIAWSDYRNLGNRSQIFCQRYNAIAQPIGVNFRIGQDSAGGPKVAVLKDGKFIVAWGRQENDTSVMLQLEMEKSIIKFSENKEPFPCQKENT
jgi:hypothetical protein